MGEPKLDELDQRASVLDRTDSSRKNDTPPDSIGIPAYSELLNRDPRWALSEGSRHFSEKSAVFQALYKIADRLQSLGIPYAVAGGMALFRHGYRRFTEDIDILVSKSDLKTIREKLSGLGYVPPFAKSKNLRDTQLGVRIEFLTTGDYPGDGKPKPIAFPDPSSVSFEADGVHYVNLQTLVELKLASGMTSPGRLKDLSDVLELGKILDLPEDFSDRLNPYVRDKFRELWKEARKRYVTILRDERITADANSFADVIASLPDVADRLLQMQADGVFLDGTGAGYVRLVTTDARIAVEYGLVDESEFWDDDE